MIVNRLQVLGYSLLFLLFTVTCPLSTAYAHTFGQPPFFKVNGEYANLYPVPVSSLYNFDLPQDLAPGNYLLNQPINFELDKARLPVQSEIIDKTKFSWDLGDGEHTQGLTTTHTYTKIGSYILKIFADDGTTPTPQILESAIVNILPNQNYSLPKSRILVQGKESKDPLTDIIYVDLSKSVELDGSKTDGVGKLEYFWDFGDQKSAFGATQTHTYKDSNQHQIFIVLRVKDESGFLSDSFVEVEDINASINLSATSSAVTKPASKPTRKNQLPITAAAIITGLAVIVTVRWWLLGRRRGKRR